MKIFVDFQDETEDPRNHVYNRKRNGRVTRLLEIVDLIFKFCNRFLVLVGCNLKVCSGYVVVTSLHRSIFHHSVHAILPEASDEQGGP
jgi:hypothetical protein